MKRIIKCPKCGTKFDVTPEIKRISEEFINKVNKVLKDMKRKLT